MSRLDYFTVVEVDIEFYNFYVNMEQKQFNLTYLSGYRIESTPDQKYILLVNLYYMPKKKVRILGKKLS